MQSNPYKGFQTSSNSLPPSTILVNRPHPSNIPANHPLFYFQEKNYFLQQAAERIKTQTRLPTADLRRNVRIDGYLNRYNKLKAQLEAEQKVRSSFLSSNEFESVIGGQSKAEIEAKEAIRLQAERQRLYQAYIEEPVFHKIEPRLINRPTIIMDPTDPATQLRLHLIDKEINDCLAETKAKDPDRQLSECRNTQLLSRVANTFLSAYVVHFDEICAELIDELLEEQVHAMNALQAQYYLSEPHHLESNRYVGKQTTDLLEMINGLNELAGD